MVVHSHVVIIIDCEIDENVAKPILDKIDRFAKSNEYFRQKNIVCCCGKMMPCHKSMTVAQIPCISCNETAN